MWERVKILAVHDHQMSILTLWPVLAFRQQNDVYTSHVIWEQSLTLNAQLEVKVAM